MTVCWTLVVAAEQSCTENAYQGGVLYPRESETREVKSLDGFWNFRTSGADSLRGFTERWYAHDLAKVSAYLFAIENVILRSRERIEVYRLSLYHNRFSGVQITYSYNYHQFPVLLLRLHTAHFERILASLFAFLRMMREKCVCLLSNVMWIYCSFTDRPCDRDARTE